MPFRIKALQTVKELYDSSKKVYLKLQGGGYDKLLSNYEKYFGKGTSTGVKDADDKKKKDEFVYSRTAFPPLGSKSKDPKIESKRKLSTAAGDGVSFKTHPYKLHLLEKGPPAEVTITRKQAMELFKTMTTMRHMELTAAELYQKQQIRGFCHLYDGQEAVATGIHAALRENDCVITSYRSHAWTYIMGGSPLPVLMELTGKAKGCSRGKGGSMHMYAKNFFGGNGIVGAQVPLGLGIAFAHQYRKSKGVCFTLYGDGAANQGQVFESFNIAKLWKIPCIFVIENNLYGMGTSIERSSAETKYYIRGGYIPGLWVDGMDFFSVYAAAKFAIQHSSEGKGPMCIEMQTYRYHGHSMSDPGTSYRTREEIQKVREKADPIDTFKKKIVEANMATAAELKKINSTIKEEMKKIGAEAIKGAEPAIEVLTEDVYAEWQEKDNAIRNVLPWKPLKHKRTGEAINLK